MVQSDKTVERFSKSPFCLLFWQRSPVRGALTARAVFLFVKLRFQVVVFNKIESAIRKLSVRAVELVKVRPHFLIAVVLVCIISASEHLVHASHDLVDSQRFSLRS